MSKLVWLALGAFAIGTESFMVAGILPRIATSFSASIGVSAHLMTIFALSYAISSPILASLLAQVPRKGLLIAALGGFGIVSLAAAVAPSLGLLMLAQACLAVAAGVYMPTANAVAVSIVGPERRGRAIAFVTGGLTIATALGVPIGIAVAALGDWRLAFILVSVLALAGVLGLAFGLPRDLPRGASSLRDRLLVAARPKVLAALSTTTLWITGNLTLYTCIAPFLSQHMGIHGVMLSVALVAFGVGSAVGNSAGGRATDRFGPFPTLRVALAGTTSLLAGLSVVALLAEPGPMAAVLAIGLFGVLGAFGWSGNAAQATRLVGLAPDAAVIALSLNASALYFGVAAGAALGSLVITYGALWQLGFVGAACEALALAGVIIAQRTRLGPARSPAGGEPIGSKPMARAS